MQLSDKDLCIAYATIGTQKELAELLGCHKDTLRYSLNKIRASKNMTVAEFKGYIASLPKTFDVERVLERPRTREGQVFNYNGKKYCCVEVLDSQSIVCSPIVGGKKFTRVRKFFRLDTLTD